MSVSVCVCKKEGKDKMWKRERESAKAVWKREREERNYLFMREITQA